MCLVYRDGDSLVFEAPDMERALAYLSLKSLAERIEDFGGRLRVVPYVEGVEDSLKSLCSSMPSDLKLDLLEALHGEGWISDMDLSAIRKSVPLGGRVAVFECNCVDRTLRLFSTAVCPDKLERMGFRVNRLKAGVEAERRIKTIVDALITSDLAVQELKTC